eukprot:1946728-Pleurochrysis_carterae.AAC.2
MRARAAARAAASTTCGAASCTAARAAARAAAPRASPSQRHQPRPSTGRSGACTGTAAYARRSEGGRVGGETLAHNARERVEERRNCRSARFHSKMTIYEAASESRGKGVRGQRCARRANRHVRAEPTDRCAESQQT